LEAVLAIGALENGREKNSGQFEVVLRVCNPNGHPPQGFEIMQVVVRKWQWCSYILYYPSGTLHNIGYIGAAARNARAK
jgi:hypothetical protein